MDRSISESFLISMSIIFAAAVLSLGLSLFRSGTVLTNTFLDKYTMAASDNRDVVADFQKGDVSLDALLLSAYKTEGVYKVILKDVSSAVATAEFSAYDDVMHPIAITSKYVNIKVVNVEKAYDRGVGYRITFTLDYSNLKPEERTKLTAYFTGG